MSRSRSVHNSVHTHHRNHRRNFRYRMMRKSRKQQALLE
jgi:uncharacterized FlgJ-related protein